MKGLATIIGVGCGVGFLTALISASVPLGLTVGGALASGGCALASGGCALASGGCALLTGLVLGSEYRYTRAHGGRFITAPLAVTALCTGATVALMLALVPAPAASALGPALALPLTLFAAGLISGLISG